MVILTLILCKLSCYASQKSSERVLRLIGRHIVVIFEAAIKKKVFFPVNQSQDDCNHEDITLKTVISKSNKFSLLTLTVKYDHRKFVKIKFNLINYQPPSRNKQRSKQLQLGIKKPENFSCLI